MLPLGNLDHCLGPMVSLSKLGSVSLRYTETSLAYPWLAVFPSQADQNSDIHLVFPKSEAPYYTKGMWIGASFCLLIVVCSIALSCILIQENKQMERDGLIPPKNAGPEDGLQDREKHLGEAAHPRYRYIW